MHVQTGKSLTRILARVPHQGSRSVELDFIRGVAILMVLGVHAFTVPTGNPLFQFLEYLGSTFGGYGVDLFFVLSGFLVGGLLMKEYKQTRSLRVRNFIFRRGLKIWPAYYFFILMEVVGHAHPLKTFLWQNLLHIQNFAGSAILHSWSLAVEEHFYLALALGMGWMVRRQWTPQRMLTLFAIVMVLGLAIRTACYFTLGAEAAQQQTQNRLDGLVFGVSLALLFHFFPEKFKSISRPTIPLVLILILAVLFVATVQNPAILSTIGYTIVYLGAGAFLLLVYSHSGRVRDWLIYRFIAVIGVYSYGIYLYHSSVRKPSLSLAMHIPASLQWPVLMLAQFSAAILLGAAMTLVVEWPLLRYRDHILPQPVADIGSPHSAPAAASNDLPG